MAPADRNIEIGIGYAFVDNIKTCSRELHLNILCKKVGIRSFQGHIQCVVTSTANTGKDRLVSVENEITAFFQSAQNFKLCAKDTAAVTKRFHMRGADVCDDGNIGFCHQRHTLDLTKIAHAHLENGTFAILGNFHNRERHTNDAVMIARGNIGFLSLAHHGGDHILGGGLPNTACYGYSGKGSSLKLCACHIRERHFAILDQDNGNIFAVKVRCDGLLTDNATASCRDCRRDVIMTVDTLAHKGKKSGILVDLARVGTNRIYVKFRIFFVLQDTAAHTGKCVRRDTILHGKLNLHTVGSPLFSSSPFCSRRRARKASFTRLPSQNGRRSPPTISYSSCPLPASRIRSPAFAFLTA